MAFDHRAYVHESDKAALNALKSIPGFKQLVKGFMKIFSERQYRIVNLSSHIRISEKQFPQYYEMLPPICEKLGIPVPDLYLELAERDDGSFFAGVILVSGSGEEIDPNNEGINLRFYREAYSDLQVSLAPVSNGSIVETKGVWDEHGYWTVQYQEEGTYFILQ